MSKRIWKQLKDFSRYEISSDGIVRNTKTGHNIAHNKESAYTKVSLYSDSARKYKLATLHRLLLVTFNPVDGMTNLQVNHKDGNKRNNCLDNLEWVTQAENAQHAFKKGLSEKKLTPKLVQQIKKELAIADRKTYREIAERFNVDKTMIGKIHRKECWHYID